MVSTNIGLGTIENVLSALEDIGFTIDTTNSIARWGDGTDKDTNNKIYFKVNAPTVSTTAIKIYNSSNAVKDNGITITSNEEAKIIYENIGDSVVFGFLRADVTGNCVHFAIIEPKDEDDSWLYCAWYAATGMDANHIIDGETEIATTYPLSTLYAGSANAIQLCKYYNGIRFAENLYETAVCASIPLGAKGNASSYSDNNYIEATIGNDTYLVINHGSATTGVKLAIKKTLLAS